MPTNISIQSETILDPRGEFRRESVKLAARPASLKGKTVLLFDNNQLTTETPRYGPIFQWVSEVLEREHQAKCAYRKLNLLKQSDAELVRLADDVAGSGVQGVVIALCNAGITQPTSLLCAELESRGLPCVQLCTKLGYPLAGITASNYVPGLPIVSISRATGAKDVFGKEQTLKVASEIVAGLTTDAARLIESFGTRFSAGNLRTARNGEVTLPAASVPAQESKGSLSIKVDPSLFDAALYDELTVAELGDGFPVIAPTAKRVEAMLAYTDLDPDLALVNELPPSGATITVRTLAANAVMAGCLPEYFPIVVAIMQAMAQPPYRLFQGAISTHPAGNAIIVSGPLADQVGLASGPGCLGPGYRANATIGRAINLVTMNVARAIPGKSDLGTFGSPAEFTYCCAESDKNNPWTPLHTDLYGPDVTSVTISKCEGPHNVLDPRAGPEELLKSIAATAATPGGNNLVHLGQIIVWLNPGMARNLSSAGWSKKDVKEFLFETARHPNELVAPHFERVSFPPYFLTLPRVPVMRSPDDVILVVCGGGGTHSMVGVPWGLSRAVSGAVTRKDGSPLKSIKGR